MPIDIDFRRDYSLLLKKELSSLGIVIGDNVLIDEIPYIYFNFMNRKIPQQSRKILKAIDFICPPELTTGLYNLEKKIIAGDDLKPHLSKQVYNNLESKDYLLNDWNIHHLHLGINICNGYVDRTELLLFCMVTEEVIYFIAMMHHGDWSDKSLLLTVYSNWPELITPFILDGVTSIINNPSNEDICKQRKGNVSMIIELAPGVVIIPPGLGYMTDGTSKKVVMRRDDTMEILSNFEDKIKSNENNIRKQIISSNKTPARTLKFKLLINDENLVAYEIYSKMFFH